MRLPHPRTAALAALVAASSLLLALPGTAGAAPACAPQLGEASRFTEFVEGNAERGGASEGAVAIGGDADFTEGFSLAALPAPEGGASGHTTLIVGGTLRSGAAGSAGFTVLERGTAVYGALAGRPPVLKSGLSTDERPPPLDFAAAFGTLRVLSGELEALPSRGTVTRTTAHGAATVRLTGEDEALNVFPVSAAQLASSRRVVLTVPEGATAVVNVSGAAYDGAVYEVVTADGTRDGGQQNEDGRDEDGRDHEGEGEDAEHGGETREVAAKLLWNFPDATTVAKPSGADWPGTVLAPHARVDLGASGSVTGTVIAASLTGVGAETRQAPFTGCLRTPLPSPDAGAGPHGERDLADTGGDNPSQTRALVVAGLGALTAGAAALWVTRRREEG
ncbi:choice-of-anchor A family protein [Streptomyces sp. JJ66]|uniref:choice-of-anchor A family protein n=1 Tax=Streptomyces sp. JJ66 TaxID=2803843 RepID=UPI001C589C9E|nr:choice-of-anchor A family protein [Streptomyces sp. JJ66]MBW1603454.1 choice-of-anchor A family protein [Streptomyces sp. JJ66]